MTDEGGQTTKDREGARETAAARGDTYGLISPPPVTPRYRYHGSAGAPVSRKRLNPLRLKLALVLKHPVIQGFAYAETSLVS